MEDRGKEMEKKEMEKSGLFKTSPKSGRASNIDGTVKSFKNSQRSIEDLMLNEDDLGIDENDMLERYTLQKMTLEWLNWNAQFFDYSEEPYLFYLSEILAGDFTKNSGNLVYDGNSPSKFSENLQMTNFMKTFRKTTPSNFNAQSFDQNWNSSKPLDVYSPFRFLSNFATANYEEFSLNPNLKKNLEDGLHQLSLQRLTTNHSQNSTMNYLTSGLGEQNFMEGLADPKINMTGAEKALAQ